MVPTTSQGTASGGVGIIGSGSYLPEGKRTNEDVAAASGITVEWITRRTGVHVRHVAKPEEAASHLAAAAVRSAVAAAGIEADDVGLLVLATSTPDELGPATACRVQALTHLRHAVALDVTAACSGWLFAAKVAYDWLASDAHTSYAVVVGVEAYSKFIDLSNRSTASLFSDGAGATVLGRVPMNQGFAGFRLGSDGTLADHALIPAGGSRRPASVSTLSSGGHTIAMNGAGVRDFIAGIFPKILAEALRQHGVSLAQVDLVVTHQPNPVLLRDVARRAGVSDEQLVVVGETVGNMGAANIPYCLATAVAQGRLHEGDLVLLIAFGGGVTWGTALLRWSGAASIRVGHDGP
jgi:3-oxoacyl-[acyl-carrier-protein] synthase-3